jgi:hypothetical protein
VRQQPEVLEDHRESMPSELAETRLIGFPDVLAVEQNLSGGRLDEAGQATDQSGLAAAGEAHHDEDLARPDIEGDVAHGHGSPELRPKLGIREVRIRGSDDLVFPGSERLPEVPDCDRRPRIGGSLGSGGSGIDCDGHGTNSLDGDSDAWAGRYTTCGTDGSPSCRPRGRRSNSRGLA